MNDSVMSTMRWTGLALYTLSFFLYAAEAFFWGFTS